MVPAYVRFGWKGGNDPMDILAYLQEVSQKLGPSGQEREVAQWLAQRFEPLCDEVRIDPLFNVIALKRATKKGAKPAPKIMLSAHQDEIALMVADILPDGTLRMGQVGGVDPRILPASTVVVHSRPEGRKPQTLIGVVGAKPPHLLSATERKQNYKREDLFIDVGLPVEKVRKLVHVGDLVTLESQTVGLLNGRAAGKTMDDRACIGVLLEAAERLQGASHAADVYFVCSTQEEVGAYGATVAAHTIDPDLAVALDVTHATIPASRPDTTVPLDAPAVTYGPFIQHKLLAKLVDCAKRNRVTINREPSTRDTGTDVDEIGVVREGIPCVLIDLPLKYMHTAVELLDTEAIRESARLLSCYIQEIDEGWDEGLWN